MVAPSDDAGQRLDKWLWVARFFKTRSLAAAEIGNGRVSVNGQCAKASRALHVDDRVVLRQGPLQRTVVVRGLSPGRAPAAVAQSLYVETAESIAARALAEQARRLACEPASAIEQGRPTKRDRRELSRTQARWQRWSAAIDED